MNMIIQIVTAIALVLSIILPVAAISLERKTKNVINVHWQ